MSIRKSNLNYVLGSAISGILSIISIPLFTWYFSVVDIGIYAVFILSVNLLTSVCTLALEQSVLRNYYDLDANGKSELYSTSYAISFFILVIMACMTWVYFDSVSLWIFSEVNTLGVLCILTSIMCTLSLKYTSITLRLEKESLIFSIGQISQRVIVLFLVLYFDIALDLKLTWHYLIVFYSISVFSISILQVLACNRMGYILIKFRNVKFQALKSNLKYSIPLFFSVLIVWSTGSLDKIFLKYYESEYELGLYANAFKFAGAAILVQQLVSTIWIPKSLKLFKNNTDIKFYRSIVTFVTFASLLFFSLFMLSIPVVKLMINHDFHQSLTLMPILMMYPIFFMISEFSGAGIIFKKQPRYALYSSIITFIANVALLYWLIPIYGALGAAISVSISYFIMFLSRTMFSMYCWGNVFSIKSILGIILIILSPIAGYIMDYYIYICLLLLSLYFMARENLMRKLL